MEKVITNGFAELSTDEMEEIDGGAFPWGEVIKGLTTVAKSHPVAAAFVVTGAAAYGCWCAGQVVGEEVGKFIYNTTH